MSFDIGKLIENRVLEDRIKDVVVSCADQGANRIYTNTTQKCVALLQYVLDCATPGNTVTWQDSDGVVKSGAMPFSATGGLVAPSSDIGWIVLSPGKSLDLFLSAAAQVSGHLTVVLL